IYGVLAGQQLLHVLAEAGLVAFAAALATSSRGSQRFRGSMASLGLITCSALLVHLSGGYVEMHFHFFVVLAVIALYEDWVPFSLAIAYVLVHHGVLGVLAPTSVFNHPDAIAHPWKWAIIHTAFVLAASVA